MSHRVEHPRDELGVTRSTAHQLAGADAVVIRGVEAESVMKDPVADRRLTAASIADREVVPQLAGHRLADAECGDAGGRQDQLLPVVSPDPGVDAVLDQQRREDRRPLPRES